MAIEKTIEINVDSKQAEKNLKAINVTIDEQRSILVLLEQEYAKSKQALDKYNASGRVNLAQEKQLKAQLTERKDALTDQRLGLKKLAVEQRAATQTVQDFKTAQKENTNIIRGVDKLTGGYATKIIKLKKGFVSGFGAIKKFVKGLSGIKKALIATGIGALVIGLATVIAYWDEITALFDNGSKALQKQAKEHKENINLSNDQLVLLENQEKILKLQGVSTENIIAEKKKVLLLQAEENSLLLNNLKIQLEKEKAQVREVSFFEKTKISALNALGQYEAAAKVLGTSINGTEEQLERLNELEKEIQGTKVKSQKIDIALLTIEDNKKKKRKKDAKEDTDNAVKAEEDRIAALEAIRKGEIDTEAERRAEKLRLVNEEYEELKASAIKYGEDITALEEARLTKLKELNDGFDETDRLKEEKRQEDLAAKKLIEQEALIIELELTKEFELLNFEEQKEILNQRDAILLADETLSEQQRTELAKQSADARAKVVDLENKAKEDSMASYAGSLSKIGDLVGKETQAGKMAASAGALISTYLNASKARTSQLAIPTPDAPIRAALAMGIEIASGLQQVKAINSVKVPKASGGGGGSVSAPSVPSAPTAPSLPPSFNIVGASDTNQLADAIGGQSQAPIQTYVVANDVTTAQSLQNNIVEGATIG